MPAYHSPTPVATISIKANFTCTNYRNAFLAFECPDSVRGHTSVPCAPGREHGIFRDQLCREAEFKEILSILLTIGFFVTVVTFILTAGYLLRKSINREFWLVWGKAVENGKDGNGLEKADDDGFDDCVGCKAPPKAFDLKKAVPANHCFQDGEGLVSVSVIHIGDCPDKAFHKWDDGKRRDGGGCG